MTSFSLFSLFRIPEVCQGFPLTLSFHPGYLTATLDGWKFGSLERVSIRKTEEFRLENENAASLENSRRSIFDPGRGRGTNQTQPQRSRKEICCSKAEYSTGGRKETSSALGASVIALLRAFASRTARERGVESSESRKQLRVINGTAREILASAATEGK